MNNYKDLRNKWIHEDMLINQRLTWLLITQTILFAGYAQIFIKIGNGLSLTDCLAFSMALFGILFSVIIRISINAAILAMNDLKKQYKGEGHIDTSVRATKKGFHAAKLMPVLFICIWTLVLAFHFVHIFIHNCSCLN